MAWTNEQKEAIYTEGTNIIVSAGAGSGKTAVLTERVLEKVKKGISVDNLLILTFTKMAAKEMKERIGDKLKKEGLTSELAKLDTADITTFDAYALSVVKKYHYYLNVSKDINIIDGSVITLYKRKILKDIFEELYEENNHEFIDFIQEYCIKDDKDIFEFILNINSKLDLKTNKREYLDNYINTVYDEVKIDNDIDNYIKVILRLISNINDYLEYIDDDDYLAKLYDVISPLLSAKSYDDIKSNISIKLPILRGASDITREYRDKIKSTIDEIKKLTTYDSYDDIKRGILSTKGNAKVIIDIIKKLDDITYNYKVKYNSYEYSDISALAIKLVRDNKEIREEIKNNLNEILIDEYQDTNDVQEEFISYISNNNVYMVGDIKQSIYRFRNANPYIFKNKYDSYSNNIGGIKIDLNKNFRSREEVINNINLLFDRIMDNDIGGADYSLSHRMIYGNLMYKGDGDNKEDNNFSVYNYLNDTTFKNNEVEAFIIADDIKNKINSGYRAFGKDTNGVRKIKYSDFAILLDSSKSFDLYKKILEYNGIPTSIVKSVNLTDGEVVLVIKNIISFIIKINDNKIDNEFKKLFISIGRSFLFNTDDNVLFDYFLNNNFKDSDIYKISYNITKRLDTISLEEIIDLIVDNFDFYNKLFLLGDYNANILRIQKLKEITNSLINLDYDIYDYQKYLDDIISNNLKLEYSVNDNSTDTVKIMTIHASKGLEFGVCYYGELYNRFNNSDAISKYSYDNKYGIILPYKDKFLYNTIYHNLSYRDYVMENISERIRLFYVALTRAKEKMIFILPSNTKEDNKSIGDIIDNSIRGKYNSFASIMYSLESITKDYYKNIDINDINLSKDYNMISNNNYKEHLKLINDKIGVNTTCIPSSIKENKTFSKKDIHIVTKEEEDKLLYGRLIHELFECTDFNNLDNLSDNNKKIIERFLEKVDISHANIYKEYEFIYDEDNTTYHGIIDLMLEYQDNIKIIDYKLKNINDDAYIKQLNGYKDYIEKLFNKKTSIYLYSITLNTLEEIK
ncbi:MAG: UvrD-helicase domain-containing protein [Bacilli bacterium]|nr:UvrD-helicase domain-containing protein [Bacilli bacterium]